MDTSNQLDKRDLLLNMENYKIILQVNSHLLEEDRLLNEHIHHRMSMMESTVSDLEMWERKRNRTEYDQSLERANRILQGIKVLIDHLLNPDNVPCDGEFQSLADQPEKRSRPKDRTEETPHSYPVQLDVDGEKSQM
jgi:hypothetical protein